VAPLPRSGGYFSCYSDERADELIARSMSSDDLEDLYEYQDYIAEQVPVVFTPNFPMRQFQVAKRIRGFEPINPFGFLNPENWHYEDGP
jgi:peptide/nickel transport system substrate-binding protein